jgi:prevent-host-death family protein
MTSKHGFASYSSPDTRASWQVQDAKARFSEFLDASIKEGPQVVTRRGVETAVLVPIDEWRRPQRASRPSLKRIGQFVYLGSTRAVIPDPSRDDHAFRECARLMHSRPNKLFEDAMLAATAVVHRLIVATRNTRDFEHFRCPLFNPFTGK